MVHNYRRPNNLDSTKKYQLTAYFFLNIANGKQLILIIMCLIEFFGDILKSDVSFSRFKWAASLLIRILELNQII